MTELLASFSSFARIEHIARALNRVKRANGSFAKFDIYVQQPAHEPQVETYSTAETVQGRPVSNAFADVKQKKLKSMDRLALAPLRARAVSYRLRPQTVAGRKPPRRHLVSTSSRQSPRAATGRRTPRRREPGDQFGHEPRYGKKHAQGAIASSSHSRSLGGIIKRSHRS
jgi:hypothetical protein